MRNRSTSGTRLGREMNSGPRVLFLVKDAREGLLDPDSCQKSVPRERRWGLPLLQEYTALRVDPWLLGVPRTFRIQRFVERLFPPPTVFWAQVLRPLARRLEVAQENYDVALSIHNGAIATLLWLRQQGRFSPRIICVLIGVADWLENAELEARKRTLEYLAEADCLLALGLAEVEFLRACGLAQTRFLPFGVDTDYWAPTGELMGDYVFAVGSDPCRDFDTLIQACPYPLKIMTWARHLISVPIPSNVSFVQGDTAALRSLYARARLVVVPLKDALQPSGQNTILQAMSMGKVVVITQTRGVWTDVLRDGENCVYVRPQNVDDLGRAIRLLYEAPKAQEIGTQAREAVCRWFEVPNLTEGFVTAIRAVVR